MASVSGYVFEPTLIKYLEEDQQNYDKSSGEFLIQPAMQRMIEDGHSIYAREIQNGTFYDTGNKLEYLKTVIDFALEREDLGPELRDFLQKRLTK